MTDKKIVEILTTVIVDGVSKTFTATAETTGDPGRSARALIFSVGGDANDWTQELSREKR